MFKSACFFRIADDFVLPDLPALERVLDLLGLAAVDGKGFLHQHGLAGLFIEIRQLAHRRGFPGAARIQIADTDHRHRHARPCPGTADERAR